MPRILVAEDEAAVRSIVSRGLARDGHEVLEVANGQECLTAAQTHRPDLLVLDIAMPGPDGLEVCSRLRERTIFEGLPILFLSGRENPSDIVGGFEAGGDDYVTKPFNLDVLCARVNALLRRSHETEDTEEAEDQADDDALRAGPFELWPCRRRLEVKGRDVDLTPTELQLFHFFMEHPGEVFSSEELLRLVWGYPYGVGEKATVRVCVRKLRSKIERDPSTPEWLVTRPRHGYALQIDQAC
jgi:DNA-binding response OmpR family regulator